jgi:hypothetical protein
MESEGTDALSEMTRPNDEFYTPCPRINFAHRIDFIHREPKGERMKGPPSEEGRREQAEERRLMSKLPPAVANVIRYGEWLNKDTFICHWEKKGFNGVFWILSKFDRHVLEKKWESK